MSVDFLRLWQVTHLIWKHKCMRATFEKVNFITSIINNIVSQKVRRWRKEIFHMLNNTTLKPCCVILNAYHCHHHNFLKFFFSNCEVNLISVKIFSGNDFKSWKFAARRPQNVFEEEAIIFICKSSNIIFFYFTRLQVTTTIFGLSQRFCSFSAAR